VNTNLRPTEKAAALKKDPGYTYDTKNKRTIQTGVHLAGFRKVPTEASGTQNLCSFSYIHHSVSYL